MLSRHARRAASGLDDLCGLRGDKIAFLRCRDAIPNHLTELGERRRADVDDHLPDLAQRAGGDLLKRIEAATGLLRSFAQVGHVGFYFIQAARGGYFDSDNGCDSGIILL